MPFTGTFGRAACAVAVALTSAFGCARQDTPRPFPPAAERLLAPFRDDSRLTEDAYRRLFAYFLEGFETYRRPDGAAADYPGYRSYHGDEIDAMEGFTRLLPLVAAWIHAGRPATVELSSGESIDLVAWMRRGILAGTDSTRSSYWGVIGDFDQRTCEAADVALALWLTRDQLWVRLGKTEQRQVARWLSSAMGRQVADNNWHLFIPLIGLVLTDLGFPVDGEPLRRHYERVKSFYRGDGWFSDGPGGTFDYYNAWAMHYTLFWIEQIDPEWDPTFIGGTRKEFLSTYRYLIARAGLPIMGRSICYRMAAPAPLVFGHTSNPEDVSASEARRALDVVWRYFIQHGAVAEGAVTQGYCGADPRILDNYSGPASCLWALRSLIVAFYLTPGSPFWSMPAGRLPIDERDYQVTIGAVGWEVRGDRETGVVEIVNRDSLPTTQTALADYSQLMRLKTLVRSTPARPQNNRAKYKRGLYSSGKPFGGCVLTR